MTCKMKLIEVALPQKVVGQDDAANSRFVKIPAPI